MTPQIADKGYRSSKVTFYRVVKLYVVTQKRPGTILLPDRVGLTAGSKNDLQALHQALLVFRGEELDRDKAYVDSSLRERLSEEQNLELLTPPKKSKQRDHPSPADKLLSEAVSRCDSPSSRSLTGLTRKLASRRPPKYAPSKG